MANLAGQRLTAKEYIDLGKDLPVDHARLLFDQVDVLRGALDWLDQHRNAQVYWYGHIYGDDDREPEEWRVDLERGSINDREWETVGRGETPLAALQSALTATKIEKDAR